jgi:hypothetical protein
MARPANDFTRSAIALVVLIQGCGAGWHRVSDVEHLAPRQQVQVWHQGQAAQWHALRVRSDTISGIPYFKPIECDSCRVALPRSVVDSIRAGNPVAGFWKSVALVLGIMVGAGIAICWDGCTSN